LKKSLSQNTSTQVQALNPKITKIHIQESPKRGQQEFLTIKLMLDNNKSFTGWVLKHMSTLRLKRHPWKIKSLAKKLLVSARILENYSILEHPLQI